MSLGPPFDGSGLAARRAVGAVTLVVVAALLAFLVLSTGRTLRPGLHLEVAIDRLGPLRAGDELRLAGEKIGEVRGARYEKGAVVLDVYVVRTAARRLPKNASVFIATPSILGEAHLEIGPPADHAEPAAVVEEGDRLRASAAPNLDQFLVKLEASLREVLGLIREQRPVTVELGAAFDRLLDGVHVVEGERGRFSRIAADGAQALEHARALAEALRHAGGGKRVAALTRQLGDTVDALGPELRALAQRLDALERAADAVSYAACRGPELRQALATMRHAVDVALRLRDQVLRLIAYVDSGQGSLGGLLADRELFDDLHETHRIIKANPLRFLLKTVPRADPHDRPTQR